MRFHQRTSPGAPVFSPGNVIFRATLLRAMRAGHTHSITSSIPQGSMPNRKNTSELTSIVNAVLKDDQIKGVVNRMPEYIKEEAGTTRDAAEWGTRGLAYPTGKRRNGYYVNLVFDAPPSLIARLERMLEIDDDILRYLTLKMDAAMIEHHEKVKAQGIADRREAAAAAAKAAAASDDDEDADDDDDEDED